MRSPDDARVYAVGECVQHRGKVYGLVAPIWDQAKVFADQVTGANPGAEYLGSKLATKLKVMGVELASMGITEPASDEDEVIQFSEPKRGTYKKLIVRDGRLVGSILMGDISKAAYLMQAFDRDSAPARRTIGVIIRPWRPGAVGDTRRNAGGGAGVQLQRREQGGDRRLRRWPARASGTRGDEGDPRRHGLRLLQGTGRTSWWSGSAGGAVEEDPSIHYYVPCHSAGKAGAGGEDDASTACARCRRCLRPCPPSGEDAASKPPLASLLATIWAGEYQDERDARFINDRVHANIQKDGTFSVVPEMPGGVCTPAELMRIAQVAVKYQVPLVKLTGGQRIDLVGIPKADLPGVWQDLDMPAGTAWGKSYRTCKSCIGTEFCRFGLGDSMGLATKIERRFRGIDSPAKMKLATAGCPRNCSEALVKDVGLVAIGDGKLGDLRRRRRRRPHPQGRPAVRRGRARRRRMLISGRFMQYYRENAKWKERTYTFVPRIGLERIRAIVVDDVRRHRRRRWMQAMQASHGSGL